VVQVSAVHDQGQDWVRIEVCDNGPGIPSTLLERVFEPFFTTKETGSGYGLYLASEILKEQGGHLSATNLEMGGACFAVWLPQVKPTASQPTETESV